MPESYSTFVKGLYQDRSKVYDDSWHPKFARTLLSYALAPPFVLPPSPLIFDLACGTGLVTIPALQSTGPDSRVYGVDFTEGMLQVAQRKKENLPSEQQERLHFIQHDITELSGINEIADLKGKFDIITCASAFVLLISPFAALTEWAKWLKPGGRLVLDTTHPHSMRPGALMETVAVKMGKVVPYNRRWSTSEDAFRRLLEENGMFEVEKIVFVEQSGSGVKFFDAGKKEAEEQFDKVINHSAYNELRTDEETVRRAKEMFVAEWAAEANDRGQVEEVDGVWVGVARRR